MDALFFVFRDLSNAFFTLLTWAIIIRAVLSWFHPDPRQVLVRLLIRFTDPILLPIQRFMPDLGGLDLTPIAAIFLLQVAQSVMGALFTSLAMIG
ncbi:MAG: hypothetical protein A2600_06080 [Candidatus Lambdaproteobacteria bacterium RIFOXYD1_FULL_56_27]|uniref:YggT family protein n=1 Tax=Candidatus Lambdaproteobacteria bacterium RIFOXYD2_FULL_56_26 TaxID=1817773 RepID=A0A1F6GLG4_9PROT|nr:MAG: hypothetical protein A2557_13120 [Candidatus Lambdaproteobacteria bacterium RIFOXYD2_FULL_56_26]OGH05457.1 MAG: hypothetical protein A2426_03650 [Candidatus Lambdaproteobacteria bacterium RIFOXYC1_FULL_56_13]OGH09748.1 MAG: hypothetical protein A2600_06080 [Candidatus Lambdaproteobacteria bacterium RIFOXYD1_FULL_56_27]